MRPQQKWLFMKGVYYSLKLEYYIRNNKQKKLNYFQKKQAETTLQNKQQRQIIASVARIILILEKRMPWKPRCLNLSLVAKKLLKEKGIETTLHIGFKPKQMGKKVEGHAWLTIEGEIIAGWLSDLVMYKELK